MADLVVIVPSRGRPGAVKPLIEAFGDTVTDNATCLMFALDADDAALPDYLEALDPHMIHADGMYMSLGDPEVAVNIGDEPGSMVVALNWAARCLARLPDDQYDEIDGEAPFAIGFMGDDHRPRTKGWDEAYLDALHEMGTGIVYGNDLLQGENLPTQCAMTSDIVRALGWMALPSLTHLFVDNVWKVIGNGAGCLRYLPDVVVEHMHPVAGKAGWDEGHVRVNAPEMYERDQTAFTQWLRTSMVEDVAKVRALRTVSA